MKKGLLQISVKNLFSRAMTEPIEMMGIKRKMPFVDGKCDECGECSQICPSGAIDVNVSWSVDIGKCIFCGECENACTKNAISMIEPPDYALKREDLIFTRNDSLIKPGMIDEKKRKTIGRSISIREVDTGSCNACEIEVNSLSNMFYDSERFGIKITASPRHADVLLITGPLTENMYDALMKAVAATPDPKVIVAMGSCAISGGLFTEGNIVGRGIGDTLDVDIFIPGCPPSPDVIIRSLLSAFGLTGRR